MKSVASVSKDPETNVEEFKSIPTLGEKEPDAPLADQPEEN